jgi:hypothetical protein
VGYNFKVQNHVSVLLHVLKCFYVGFLCAHWCLDFAYVLGLESYYYKWVMFSITKSHQLHWVNLFSSRNISQDNWFNVTLTKYGGGLEVMCYLKWFYVVWFMCVWTTIVANVNMVVHDILLGLKKDQIIFWGWDQRQFQTWR